MASRCQFCNENEYYPEEEVCKACGIVTEGTQFGSEFHQHSRVIPFDSHHNRRKKHLPGGLGFGMNILDSLSNVYNLSSIIKAEVIELLTDVYYKNFFKQKQDVGILAGCCLNYILRKHHQFVPFTDLCAKLKCSKKTVYKFLKMVKSYLKDPNKTVDHEEDVDNDLEKNSGSSSPEYLEGLESAIRVTLSSIPDESKVQLSSKTTALIKLAYSLWVGSGRSTEGLISAAAFLCWKSMHPSRRTLTLSSFCRDFSLNYNKARLRVPELKNMLLKLGKEIPSLTKNYVNEKNVLFHLDYILENSVSLRNDLLTEEFSLEEINKKEFSSFRKPPVQTEKEPFKQETEYASDMCASDIEISDTEINSYIRTEEQIEMIKTLREQAKDV